MSYIDVDFDHRSISHCFNGQKILGKPPFDSQTQHETIRMIRSIELTFPLTTSSDLRDLITKVILFRSHMYTLVNNFVNTAGLNL
jgi:hypothetical protein